MAGPFTVLFVFQFHTLPLGSVHWFPFKHDDLVCAFIVLKAFDRLSGALFSLRIYYHTSKKHTFEHFYSDMGKRTSAVTFIFFVTILCHIFARQSCRERRSLHGFALVHHVYQSFTADRLAECFIACNAQSSCQSLNYDLVDKTCQFNNNTKYYRAKYLVEKPTSVYADNPDSGELPCITSLVLEVKVDARVSFFCHDFIVILQNCYIPYRLFSKLFTLT